MSPVTAIIEDLNRSSSRVDKNQIDAIDTLNQINEFAEFYEVGHYDDEQFVLSTDNEINKELIKAIVDGLCEEIGQ